MGEPDGWLLRCVARARGGLRRRRHGARGSRCRTRHRQLRPARRRACEQLASLTGMPRGGRHPLGRRQRQRPVAAVHALRGRRAAPRHIVDARPCAWVFTSATLAIGEDFGHFCRPHRFARSEDTEDRQSVRLPPAGAHLSAARHAGAAAPGLRAEVHRGLRAAARGERRAGLLAVHQLSRAGRRASPRSRRAFRSRLFPSWCRVRRRARRCSSDSASSATPCCSPPAASGRAWT